MRRRLRRSRGAYRSRARLSLSPSGRFLLPWNARVGAWSSKSGATELLLATSVSGCGQWSAPTFSLASGKVTSLLFVV